MLPVSLAGSYKKYKADTTAFTGWLLQTAIKCGWKPCQPQLVSSRGGVIETNGGLYTTTTTELRTQAEIVAHSTKPRIRIPVSVVHCVKRCISARERCAAWYKRPDVARDATDDDGGHQHYIGVLKEVLQILSSCIIEETPKIEPSCVQKKSSAASDAPNKFSILEVEEAREFLGDFNPSSMKKTSKTSHQSVDDASNAYESLSSQKSEASFDVWCFFEDLHELQTHLEEVWHRYSEHEIDVVTAALVTNAAIALVRRAEADLLDSLENSIDVDGTFAALLQIIAGRDILREESVSCLLSSYEGRTSDLSHDEFLYLATARTLLEWSRLSESTLPWSQELTERNMDRLCAQLAQSRRQPERACRRRIFLLQSLLNSRFDAYRHRDYPLTAAIENHCRDDLFSESEAALWESRNMKAWMVFASHIIVRINEILGVSSYRPCQDAVDAAAIALVTVTCHQSVRLSSTIKLEEHEYEAESGLMIRLSNMAVFECALGRSMCITAFEDFTQDVFSSRGAVLDDAVAFVLRKVGKALVETDITAPDATSSIPFSHNPLFCGNIIMRIQVLVEAAGMRLADSSRSILPMAHLYNAVCQMNLLDHKWHELDACIQDQMPALFGSQFPKKPSAMLSRMLTRMGYSSTNFVPLHKSRICPCTAISARGESQYRLRCNPVTSLLQQYYDAELNWEQLLYRLNDTMGSQTGYKRRPQQVWRLEPLVYLPRLEASVFQTSQKLQSVDYLKIGRECTKCLSLIGAMIKRNCKDFGPRKMCEDCRLFYDEQHDWLVRDILSDCVIDDSNAHTCKKHRDKTRIAGGEAMKQAANVLTKFLMKKNATKNSPAGETQE